MTKNKEKLWVRIHDDSEKTARWSILYFYGSYGLFYVIAIIYRLFLPVIDIPFYIAELNKPTIFKMQLAEWMDLILLGIIFSYNSYKTWHLLQKTIPDEKKKSLVSFLVAIILLNFAVISHMIANQLNEFMHQIESDPMYGESFIEGIPALSNLMLGLYFWDEIFSHLLTGFGFFLLVFIFIRLDRKNGNEYVLKGSSLKLLSFVVGAGVAAGLIEGQAAAVYFVVALFIMFLTLFGKKKNPFTNATFYMTMGYVILTIIYAAFTGLKGNYPYLKQFSEL